MISDADLAGCHLLGMVGGPSLDPRRLPVSSTAGPSPGTPGHSAPLRSRIDPLAWPPRVQEMAIGLLIVLGAVLAWLNVALQLALLTPVMVGALVWRFDGFRLREILSWTVPLAIGLLVQDVFLRRPLDLVVVVVLIGVLIAMIFSERARMAWVGIVSPGAYRIFTGDDRRIDRALSELGDDTESALAAYMRTSDHLELHDRLDAIASRLEAIPISDPSWEAVRSNRLAHIRASAEIAVDPHSHPDEDFKLARASWTTSEDQRWRLFHSRATLVGRGFKRKPPNAAS